MNEQHVANITEYRSYDKPSLTSHSCWKHTNTLCRWL